MYPERAGCPLIGLDERDQIRPRTLVSACNRFVNLSLGSALGRSVGPKVGSERFGLVDTMPPGQRPSKGKFVGVFEVAAHR